MMEYNGEMDMVARYVRIKYYGVPKFNLRNASVMA